MPNAWDGNERREQARLRAVIDELRGEILALKIQVGTLIEQIEYLHQTRPQPEARTTSAPPLVFDSRRRGTKPVDDSPLKDAS